MNLINVLLLTTGLVLFLGGVTMLAVGGYYIANHQPDGTPYKCTLYTIPRQYNKTVPCVFRDGQLHTDNPASGSMIAVTVVGAVLTLLMICIPCVYCMCACAFKDVVRFH